MKFKPKWRRAVKRRYHTPRTPRTEGWTKPNRDLDMALTALVSLVVAAVVLLVSVAGHSSELPEEMSPYPKGELSVSFARYADAYCYSRGLKRVGVDDDGDEVAGYFPLADAVLITERFLEYPQAKRVAIILHEFGHRGTFTLGRETFAEFKRRGLGKRFPSLESPSVVNRYSPEQYDQEAFATSYASYMLGLKSPVPEIQEFWEATKRPESCHD